MLQLLGLRDVSLTGPALHPASDVDGKRETTLLCPCQHKADGQWNQWSHVHDFEAGSPTFLLTGLALLCCPGRVQGLFSWVLQLGAIRDSSPAHMTTGTALLCATGGDGQER